MVTRIIKNESLPSLSMEALVNLEGLIGVALPGDYRNFLLEYNGGEPKPSFFWIEKEVDGSEVDQFYGLYDELTPDCIRTYSGEERYGIPRIMLPIGEDGMGNILCIGISQQNLGEIFFLDHDHHPYDDPESTAGITKLADSFTDFLESLIDPPE